MASLFEGHHLALQNLVPNLLQLYADIEFKSRGCIEEAHTQVGLLFKLNQFVRYKVLM